MSDFKGKVVIVTGSGRGFGAATIRRFAELGANVVISDIVFSEETDILISDLEKMNANYMKEYMDVTDKENIHEVFEKVYNQYEHIDILINNAGISRMKSFEDMMEDDGDMVIDINLKSMFLTTQEIFPYFKKNKSSRIANLASISGQLAGLVINYGVSKAGVIQLTRNAARYGAPYEILVNAVAPGIILTEMTREELQTPVGKMQLELSQLKRLGVVIDVVEGIIFLVSFDQNYITGHTLNINGGTL